METATNSAARRPELTAVAATGYVLSWLAGLVLAPAGPTFDASASEVTAFYAGHGGAVTLSASLVHGTAGIALAALAIGIARAAGAVSGLRRVVVGTGVAAAALSLLQWGLDVIAVAGAPEPSTSRTLFQSINFLDVVKLALLAAFAVAATHAITGAPRWLRAMASALVPLLLAGSAAVLGVRGFTAVLELSLLVLLAWAAGVGIVLSRR